jgi:hypothetical protein
VVVFLVFVLHQKNNRFVYLMALRFYKFISYSSLD